MQAQEGSAGGNTISQDDEDDKHRLDESSFERFWSKAWSEALRFRKKEWGFKTMKLRSSGGDEVVQDNWGAFSKDRNDVEYLHDPFKDLPLSEEPSIYRDLAIYDQARFLIAPVARPPVVVGEIKVVVFDLYGVILDRQEGLRRALRTFLPLDTHEHDVDKLVGIYLEIEAHRVHGAPDISGNKLVHAVLDDTLRAVGLCPTDDTIQSARDAILPVPYTDVSDALNTLRARGYQLLCMY
ncbi:hypothetical protein POSPLADRAFT_1106977, partial [Postia placenta MAD-698-R-SB12]